MPNRIIKESICTSENIDKLTPFQETVFYRLMVNCDDFGRFDGRPKVLASRLFPLKDITREEMREALDALVAADLVTIADGYGKPVVIMKTWGKHQRTRATESKYPLPSDNNGEQLPTNDSNCQQPTADADNCARNRNRNRNTENDNRNSESESLIPDAEAARITAEQNRVIDAAEDAGFKLSNDVRQALVALYADHGLQKMLDSLRQCSEYGVTTLAYLKAVLTGKPKKTVAAVPAQQYNQRNNTGATAQAFEEMRRMIRESRGETA